ncbi:MAG TPA: helix-turn-helix domain-containing protein [Conexibacter sp.]|nr:helix-turn-helix domain-containing protein [Conexibacter sp.]
MEELPLIELPTEQTERADAASNRRRILAAATELFAQRGPDCVSMQDVAKAAGVGMGTMYRRFGDRAGLTFALLGERHRELQEQLLRGAPPLGPGAPPTERLHAFGRARLALLDDGEAEMLLTTADAGGATLRGPDAAYRTHLAVLLRELAPALDVEYAVNSLVMAFDARLHVHLRRERGWRLARIQDGWCGLVDAWVAAGASGERTDS